MNSPIRQKLESILATKKELRAVLRNLGLDTSGGFVTYPNLVRKVTLNSIHTGRVDEEGLRAIGWDDDDILYFSKYGVHWNLDQNEEYKVSQDTIDLYNEVDADGNKVWGPSNFHESNYKINYLPKWDWSNQTRSGWAGLLIIGMPKIDTSHFSTFAGAFKGCEILSCVPALDTRRAGTYSSEMEVNMKNTVYKEMFSGCINLQHVDPLTLVFQPSQSLIDAGQSYSKSVTVSLADLFLNCSALGNVELKLDFEDIPDGLKVDCTNMFGGCSSLSVASLRGMEKFSGIAGMFKGCGKLYSIDFGEYDPENGTYIGFDWKGSHIASSLADAFSYCSCLDEVTIPASTTANCTLDDCCRYSRNLRIVHVNPDSRVTSAAGAFYGCNELREFPSVNWSTCTNYNDMFGIPADNNKYSMLESIGDINMTGATSGNTSLFGTSGIQHTHLTHMEGLTGLKYTIDLSMCTALDKESILNIFNTIGTAANNRQTITIPAKFQSGTYALTSTESRIATNKRWSIAYK